MRVLVTGGCGFIGSHICDALEGHEVLALDNLSIGKKEWVSCRVEVADIADTENMDRIFSEFKPECVIHTAAQVMLRASLDDPVNDAKQNIIGTISILEACRNHDVKKIIYTSTGGARYGEPEKLPVKESDTVHPISPYGISKHTAEHYIEMYGKLYGLDYLILCFGNVYGPRDEVKKGRVVSVFIDKLLRKKNPQVFGDGKQTRDFLYVKDIARVIVDNLSTKSKDKLFNISSGQQTSVKEIFEIIEAELQTGLKIEYVDAIKGEIRDILLDISLAKEQLGFKATPIEHGIKETIPWYREEADSDAGFPH